MRGRLLIVLALLASLLIMPAPARAGSTDYDIPSGHFYTQAVVPGTPSTYGYAITNAGQDDRGQPIRFWSEFMRLGGVSALGYVATQRFWLDGFTVQGTQRVILQWRSDLNRAVFINVFDKLHDLGKDPELQAKYRVPPQVALNDAGKPFAQVVEERLAYLDAQPALKVAYFTNRTNLPVWNRDVAIELYGLSTSQVVDVDGVFEIVRCQRVVFQYWKKSIPGIAEAGQITLGLGGDFAKEFGLVAAPALPPTAGPDAPPVQHPSAGHVLFGSDYRVAGDSLEIMGATSTFIAGEPFASVAYLREPIGNGLTIISEYTSPTGVKFSTTVTFAVPNPQWTLWANRVAGQTTATWYPGTYVVQYVGMHGKVLASGSYEIRSPGSAQLSH